MQNRRGLIIIASLLVLISLVLYIALFLIFNDAKDIFFYTLLDLAFLPLQVLIVGIIIERIMVKREIDEKISKLKMDSEGPSLPSFGPGTSYILG